jgi:Tol biopolymer transport system component
LDATFWAATPDGSKVLFTTNENLVDADTSNETAPDLYMYDVNAPAGHRLTLISRDDQPSGGTGANVRGVTGMSSDGSYVYFTAVNQLETGKPLAPAVRMFVWHDDGSTQTVREVANVTHDAFVSVEQSWRIGFNARVSPDGRRVVFLSVNHGGVAAFGSFGHVRYSGRKRV